MRTHTIAAIALCLSGACGHGAGDVPKNLEPKRLHYEGVVAEDPDNYNGNFSLSSLYAGYYMFYVQVHPDAGKAKEYQAKTFAVTQKALQKAQHIDDKALLAINLERSGYTNEAVAIYREFLTIAESEEKSPAPPHPMPDSMQHDMKNRSILISQVKERLSQLSK
jgi:hypothetical protein